MSTSVFDEGQDAFNDGKDISENPYEADTDEHREWAEGFAQAEQDHDDELEEEGGD